VRVNERSVYGWAAESKVWAASMMSGILKKGVSDPSS
jgi:hypothetical protein